MCTVNLLEGVFGQAGNTQKTCSRNPAPVSKMSGLWVDLFLLKQHEKKRKLELCTGEASAVEDATTEQRKKSRQTHAEQREEPERIARLIYMMKEVNIN